MAKISLCLIARDEEQMLPGALESVYGAVDELIVVDTGSRDRTKEVAESAGALVVDHFWQDDFSAARNQALLHATGEWILVLDADERLAPGASTAIREGVENDSFDCGLLPLFNANRLDATITEVLEGSAQLGEPVLLPRLFRRSLDLKWEGVVHENVATWLAGDKTIAVLEAPLVHYGAAVEIRSQRNKDHRNLRLLERRCAIEPQDPIARTYLVRELLRAEEGERAHLEVQRAWDDLVAVMGDPRSQALRPSVVTTATLRAYLFLTQGQAKEAVEVVRVAQSWGETHPNFDLLLGNALLATCPARPDSGLLDEIEATLQEALDKRGRVYVEEVLPGATSYAAHSELGALHLLRGDIPSASACFVSALEEKSDHEPARLGLLECMVYQGQLESVLAELEPLLTDTCADAWVIGALVYARLAKSEEAREMLERARGSSGRFLAPHRHHVMGRLSAEIHAKALLYHIAGGSIPTSAATGQEARDTGEQSFLVGKVEQAQKYFIDALDQNIGDTTAWTNLGVTLHTQGHHEWAAQALQVGLALEPDDIDARLNLAQVMYSMERPHAATECLRGVLQRAPESPMAHELLSWMGVVDNSETGFSEPPSLSVLMRVDSLDGLQRSLDWIALQDLDPVAYEVLLVADTMADQVDSSIVEGRPFDLHVCESTTEAMECAEGRWVLLLEPGALPAADCFRLHLDTHQQTGSSIVVVGAVELAVDSRTTPLLEVLASTSLLDDPLGVRSLTQPRGGSGACNISLPIEVLSSLDPDEIWRGDLEAVVRHSTETTVITEPSMRVYREVMHDLESYQRHCFRLGYSQFRLGTLYRQSSLLPALAGADPEVEENWLMLRARLERQRDTIRGLWLEASRVEASLLPSGDHRITALQRLHRASQRIGAHAFEVGQVVAATGVQPEQMNTPSSLRTELTSVLMMNSGGFSEVTSAIESLRDTAKGPVEVLVLSRGLEDGSDQWLANQPDITVLDTSRLGSAAAWNVGLANARGRTLFFCDSSIQFIPFWRELHLEHLEQWPDIGLVSSVSISGQGSQRFSGGSEEQSLSGLARGLFESWRGQHSYVANFGSPVMMARMQVVERVGGFDVRFSDGGLEFVDWYQRVRLAGSRLRVAQDCLMGWATPAVSDGSKDSWRALNEKWGTQVAYSEEGFEQVVLCNDSFHEARRFVAYQSEEDARALIEREPKLINSTIRHRKVA